MAREFFQCYHSYLKQCESLSDAEFGRLIRAALRYSATGQKDDVPGQEKYALGFLTYNIDNEKRAYEDKCRKNREIKIESLQRTTTNDNERIRTITKEEEKKEKEEEKKEYLPTEEGSSVRDRVSVSSIVELYNSICVSFPKVVSISEKRKTAVKARLKAYSVDNFVEVFTKAENSSFLKGANERNWSATFDWLIADSNFAKVLDGNYDYKHQISARKQQKKTRYVPNSARNTNKDFEVSMAIIEAELNGKSEQDKWIDRSMSVIDEALERGKV